MTVIARTVEKAAEVAAEELGIADAGFTLDSPEGLAASVRRAASFLCPATQRQLADAVIEVLQPLLSPQEPRRDQVNTMIEALVLNGDLIDAPTDEGRRLLFLGPPSFVERNSDSCLLVGIRPFGAAILDLDDLLEVNLHRHTRLCRSLDAPIRKVLEQTDLQEIAKYEWLAVPDTREPITVIREVAAHWRPAGQGPIPGLRLIDKSRPVTHYLKRWREPQPSDEGVFVGRRPREFGADLWCYLSISDGKVTRLVDLPVSDPSRPGCDEAWRLQAAMDSARGHRQVFTCRSVDGDYVLDCFSPVPSWADHYLAFVGNATEKARGALFSYRLPASTVEEAKKLLTDMLWMRMIKENEAI